MSKKYIVTTDDNGNEIQLNTGKTYIAVAQNDKSVIFR